jgi:hypothetical protein
VELRRASADSAVIIANMAIVMTQAAERRWRGLPPERNEAAQSTVEAVMYELRQYGIEQLKNQNTQHRLAELQTGNSGKS